MAQGDVTTNPGTTEDDPNIGHVDESTGTAEEGGQSPEEAALLAAITDMLGIQTQGMRQQVDLFATLAPAYRDLFLAQSAYGVESTNLMRQALGPALGELARVYNEELGPLARVSETERLATENTNKYLRGESLLTPQDIGRLDTIFARARSQGVKDIQTFGEEQAAARGLRVTDTPIGSTAQQATADLSEGLGSARAQAELGMEQAKFSSAEAVRQFQTNLRAAATSNRAALVAGFTPAGRGGGGGPGGALPTVGGGDTGGAFSYLSNLSNQRATSANLAASQGFTGGQNDLNRQNAIDVANINQAGKSPGALDYLSIIGGLVGKGLSLF